VTDATHQVFLSKLASILPWSVLFWCLCGTGCATVPYKYGHFHSSDDEVLSEVAFEYGKPQKTLDNIAWFTGIWSRILFMNCGMNKHELSENTKEKLVAYLEENDLNDVLVRVNQYDPKGEWQRLRDNKRVGAGWRYTLGVIGLVEYTLLPGRVFGGDEYNPFTNTLYVNSDVPAVVLHEAAYAKDIHGRRLPGTYAFINDVPLMSLWRRTTCVNDVLGYAQVNGDWDMEVETYEVVYPQMGVSSIALAGSFVPFWDGLALTVVGAAAGHATGRVAIYQRGKQKTELIDDSDPGVELGFEDLPNTQPNLDSSEKIIKFTRHETDSSDER
jgi:hypothetical protein